MIDLLKVLMIVWVKMMANASITAIEQIPPLADLY